MRYLIVVFLLIGFISCNGESTSEDELNKNGEHINDNGIVEYELDENRTDAVAFNNDLTLIQSRVYDQINLLFKSDTSNAQINYDNTLFEVNVNLEKLQKMNGPSDGEAFKDALIELLQFYKGELENEFKEIIPILELSVSERSANQQGRLDAYDVEFAKKEQAYFTKVNTTQIIFAKANNFTIK